MSNVPNCPFCSFDKVIKHGKTPTGNPRFRCRNCGKTWVLEKTSPIRPDMAEITESHLDGQSCRDLVDIYQSSPLRINQKIREYLEGCPDWEDYLDTIITEHKPRLVYLTGKKFACNAQGSKDNIMFAAMAIDALSSMILGFEIGTEEDTLLWKKLLERMDKRGFNINSFITNGTRNVEDAVRKIFPFANLRINYHKAYRDRELNCCLANNPLNNKLIYDATRIYSSLNNHNLLEYLGVNDESQIEELLFLSREDFFVRIKEHLDNKNTNKIRTITDLFQDRFEKFHMLKENPYPIINGWIAMHMMNKLDIGFSRLSLYAQVPMVSKFKDFACGNKPIELNLKPDSPLLKKFVIEIAARSLELPVIFSKCEMRLERCCLA